MKEIDKPKLDFVFTLAPDGIHRNNTGMSLKEYCEKNWPTKKPEQPKKNEPT